MKVCHFTSAHFANDDRIYLKECRTLFDAGYEVVIVAKGEDRELDGIRVAGCGEASGRLGRLFGFSKKVYKTALEQDCDVYHFHDPELLPYGIKLKKKGKIVIFDSHEDVPGQILDKYWIPKPLRSLVSKLYRAYETRAAKKIDTVVAATPYIAEQFRGRARKIAVVNNYPMLDDIRFCETPFEKRERIACYAGGISELRGEKIMNEAALGLDVSLVLAGDCDEEKLGTNGNVTYLGKIDRNGVNELYGSAVLGLCILLPAKNYVNSQPIKMYEYMAAGLPFVCSDFPIWKEIAEGSGAGICVPYNDMDAIRGAINTLLEDREKAQEMGRRGRKAVEEKYSWDSERRNLLGLYKELMGNGSNTL